MKAKVELLPLKKRNVTYQSVMMSLANWSAIYVILVISVAGNGNPEVAMGTFCLRSNHVVQTRLLAYVTNH